MRVIYSNKLHILKFEKLIVLSLFRIIIPPSQEVIPDTIEEQKTVQNENNLQNTNNSKNTNLSYKACRIDTASAIKNVINRLKTNANVYLNYFQMMEDNRAKFHESINDIYPKYVFLEKCRIGNLLKTYDSLLDCIQKKIRTIEMLKKTIETFEAIIRDGKASSKNASEDTNQKISENHKIIHERINDSIQSMKENLNILKKLKYYEKMIFLSPFEAYSLTYEKLDDSDGSSFKTRVFIKSKDNLKANNNYPFLIINDDKFEHSYDYEASYMNLRKSLINLFVNFNTKFHKIYDHVIEQYRMDSEAYNFKYLYDNLNVSIKDEHPKYEIDHSILIPIRPKD